MPGEDLKILLRVAPTPEAARAAVNEDMTEAHTSRVVPDPEGATGPCYHRNSGAPAQPGRGATLCFDAVENVGIIGWVTSETNLTQGDDQHAVALVKAAIEHVKTMLEQLRTRE